MDKGLSKQKRLIPRILNFSAAKISFTKINYVKNCTRFT